MSTINVANREINFKIVYYGPGLSGKTTNLKWIYSKVPEGRKGEMVSLATEDERTLFFDFLPLDIGEVKGFKTRFHLYTVPGQVFYNASRKLILRGVDGIVFVADSAPNRLRANAESMRNMRENLAEYGLTLDDVPIVVQVNKRDLPDALPVEMVRAVVDPEARFPVLGAVATEGTAVVAAAIGAAWSSPAWRAGLKRPTRPGAGRPAPFLLPTRIPDFIGTNVPKSPFAKGTNAPHRKARFPLPWRPYTAPAVREEGYGRKAQRRTGGHPGPDPHHPGLLAGSVRRLLR